MVLVSSTGPTRLRHQYHQCERRQSSDGAAVYPCYVLILDVFSTVDASPTDLRMLTTTAQPKDICASAELDLKMLKCVDLKLMIDRVTLIPLISVPVVVLVPKLNVYHVK